MSKVFRLHHQVHQNRNSTITIGTNGFKIVAFDEIKRISALTMWSSGST